MTRILIFLIVKIRPNIIFAIIIASYFTKNPNYINIKVVKISSKYFQKKKKILSINKIF